MLELFTLKFPLYLGRESKEYNTVLDEKQLSLFGVKLPVRLYTREFKYTQTAKITRTDDQIKEMLETEIEEILEQEKITDYTVESKEFSETQEGITFKIVVLSQQNIAYEDFLLISTGN